MFFQKNPFFQNFQNEVVKCFQTVSIRKKMIKIDRKHYKRKLLSPKCFSKNHNWIRKSRPKFSNFPKMAILREWKYPIFVPKVYKIIKLRQLFIKMSANNFKILHSDGFLRFFDIFLEFKKNGGKSPAKITKSAKLRQFFMSILKGLKWFSEKYSREEISSFYYYFSISYFFLVYEHPKATKRGLRKKCWICCKNSTNVAKKHLH